MIVLAMKRIFLFLGLSSLSFRYQNWQLHVKFAQINTIINYNALHMYMANRKTNIKDAFVFNIFLFPGERYKSCEVCLMITNKSVIFLLVQCTCSVLPCGFCIAVLFLFTSSIQEMTSFYIKSGWMGALHIWESGRFFFVSMSMDPLNRRWHQFQYFYETNNDVCNLSSQFYSH